MYEAYAEDGLMVVTLLRSAGDDGIATWAEDYGLTHPVLNDTGTYGDYSIQLSLDGHTPSNHLVGRGGVLQIHDQRITEADVREALGL